MNNNKLSVTTEEIEKELSDFGIMSPEQIVAMTVWSVAKSHSPLIKQMIAGVIHNRALRNSNEYPYFMKVISTCMDSDLFTCWKNGKFIHDVPIPESSAWSECMSIASALFDESYQPPTTATHYVLDHYRCYFGDYDSKQNGVQKMEFVGRFDNCLFFLDDEWIG